MSINGARLQPQRGCVTKPRAVPKGQPWVAAMEGPSTPTGLWPAGSAGDWFSGRRAATPLGLRGIAARLPRVGAAPTLIVDPKLFTGGEESPRKLSPQPTVNNFAARVMAIVNKVNFGARAPRSRRAGKTNGPTPYLARSKPRLSLPARRLGPKRILKMTTLDVSAIRTSPGPSQRALSTSTSQLL